MRTVEQIRPLLIAGRFANDARYHGAHDLQRREAGGLIRWATDEEIDVIRHYFTEGPGAR